MGPKLNADQGLGGAMLAPTKAQVKPGQLFIGGRFTPSISGKTFHTINPATGAVLPKDAEGRAADVDAAVKAAGPDAAEQTPVTALIRDEILAEAGLPEGVPNGGRGFGPTAGGALVGHMGVDKIAFTGSTPVGQEILRASAGNLKRVSLELGG